MDDISNTVVPFYTLPNMKQGQNGVEAAFTIYGIFLNVKAHLPGPKEVIVSNTLFLSSGGSFIVDCCFHCNRQLLLLHPYKEDKRCLSIKL
jgi:hypothetical protein